MKYAIHALLLLILPVAAGADKPNEKSPVSIDLTLVDDKAIAYATFQSHNQKVISNRHGIFITYVRKSNKNYTAQQWRLARSTDGGKSFTTVFEETRATSAPVLETDKQGRLFLARPRLQERQGLFVSIHIPNRQAAYDETCRRSRRQVLHGAG